MAECDYDLSFKGANLTNADFETTIYGSTRGDSKLAFDNAILEPIAKGYNKLPEPIKNGTSNFTSNIATLLSIPNHLAQGNFKGAGDATASFLINSTIGIIGLANPAEKMGLNAQKEDVGQTLGAYGIGPGCYFVLPILGPTTARDSIGMIADTFVDPFAHVTWREKELFGTSSRRARVKMYAIDLIIGINFKVPSEGPCSVSDSHP